MTAFARMCSRLGMTSCRCQYADFILRQNRKCLLQNLILQQSSLSLSSPRALGDADHGPTFTQKMPVDKYFDRSRFIGKQGMNIKGLIQQCGEGFNIQVNADHILISGPDAEGVKLNEEKILQEVQRCVFSQTEKVMTDEDALKHSEICKIITGKGGQNIKRLLSAYDYESINVDSHTHSGHILVSSADAEMVTRAVEILKQEVERAKNIISVTLKEQVKTDDDAEVHSNICRLIAGKGGQNIKLLVLELGNVNVDLWGGGDCILVSGTDSEMVSRAVEKLNQEVERVKKNMSFTKKVMIDEDPEVCSRIHPLLLGKGGWNIKRLLSELKPINVTLNTRRGHILISGTDVAMVKRAVEVFELEVKKAKSIVTLPIFSKKKAMAESLKEEVRTLKV